MDEAQGRERCPGPGDRQQDRGGGPPLGTAQGAEPICDRAQFCRKDGEAHRGGGQGGPQQDLRRERGDSGQPADDRCAQAEARQHDAQDRSGRKKAAGAAPSAAPRRFHLLEIRPPDEGDGHRRGRRAEEPPNQRGRVVWIPMAAAPNSKGSRATIARELT